ncbi:O-antigen ligase family protein [Paraconexibacter sp.]|uniref:O-antigen ligase family protein n=1 Tax=Paraconexibacter sp. TaxID=2949640 RepID=UPI00356A7EB5
MTSVALIACAALAAGALVGPSSRVRAGALLGSLVLAPIILVAHIWDSSQLDTLRDRPAVAAIGIVLGLAVLVALARLLDRRPQLFPIAVVATVPFRVPISAGGSTANLLLPLYLVVAAGAIAYALPRLRGDDAVAEDGAEAEDRPGALEWLLGATLVLYAAQTISTADRDHALEQLVFFYVPFAALFLLLGRVRWSADLLRRCLLVLGALALGLVAVGFYEYATKTLLLNPKVIASNQFEDYFRVNSLFFDPNIYGRFLAVVMIAYAGVLLWGRRAQDVARTGLVLGVLWTGLVLTLSQSSFAALLLGLAVLAGLRWNPRKAALTAGSLAVATALVVLAAPGLVNLDLSSGKSVDEATSGRYDLIAGGVGLIGERPVLGHGSGSFSREYRRREQVSAQRATSASHTIPVTVAAEQGLVGLAVYLALLAAALSRLLRGASLSLARSVIAAAFLALLLHTMVYAAFLEDPLSWALLAVGTALWRHERASRNRPEHDALATA